MEPPGIGKLNKNLASRQQMGEAGTVIAGQGSRTPFRNAAEAAGSYGGDADDYVKKSSSKHLTPDGRQFETHWIENIRTGERMEYKTKLLGHHHYQPN